MKRKLLKIFTIPFILCVFLLSSCDHTDDTTKNKEISIDYDDIIQNIVNSNTSEAMVLGPMTLYRLYRNGPLEGSISNESRIVCGYLESETIEKISDKFYVPADDIFYADGIGNDNFLSYQVALQQKDINLEEDKLFLYEFENEIPYTYENRILVTVLEIVEIELKDGQNLFMYGSVEGELKDGFYYLNQETRLDKYKGKKIVYMSQFIPKRKYFYAGYFSTYFLLVEKIDNREVLQTAAWYDTYINKEKEPESWTKYKNYYDLMEPAFIKEIERASGSKSWYYDYALLKNILKIK
ncbi:MAG: hypothetical protein K2J85_03875 [Anaeroplasmataceae bacterium]|nr:hypothetical protein [Anaeroplasmataceae bacterium]